MTSANDNRTTERVDHPPRVREAIDELMREKDATDNRTTELREKLTERGVEFATDDFDHLLTTYWQANNVFVQYLESIGDYVDEDDPTMKLRMNNVTPEQAVAATLGNRPTKSGRGYYTDRDDEGTHIMCDDCGGYIGTAEEIAATLGSRRNTSLDNVDAERDTQFAKAMRRIVERNTEFGVTDIEESHRKADELMCDLLLAHGYAETVDAFKNMRKWYG